jgi:hypothetical protein
VFELPPPPLFVVSHAVSVIAGVVRADGVLLVTDRALTNPAIQVAPGTSYRWPDRTKLVGTPGGVAIGMAGVIGAGSAGPAADLLTAAAARAAGARRASEVATAVRDLFNEVAADIRAYAAAETGPATTTDARRAPTVALVAGPSPTGPELIAVALAADGPAREWLIPAPGLALGPTLAVGIELDAAVQRAALEPLPAALDRLGGALRAVAVEHFKDVSATWDYVLVEGSGAGPITPHEAPRFTLTRGA